MKIYTAHHGLKWSRIILISAALMLGGCPRTDTATAKGGHGESEHGKEHKHGEERGAHKEHSGHDHGEGEEKSEQFNAGLLSRIKTRKCEHKVAILDCDECRYEVGAVKLSSAIMKAGKAALIKTAQVAQAARPSGLLLTGEVVFDEKKVVHISPLIRGVARRVFVTTGDRVKAGGALFEMESIELGRLRSKYLQSRARVKLTRENYEREKKLHADQISSAKDRLQSETLYHEAEIALKAARDQLRLIGHGGRNLSRSTGSVGRGSGRMTVRSPMAGIVVAKHMVPGERLSPDKEVLTIADLSTVWVWANVYERDLARLLKAKARTGRLKAGISVTAFAGQQFAGELDYVGATMEEATRTVKVRALVTNSKSLLRPGMFASVAVELGEGAKALVIPSEAVVSDEGEQFVFVSIGGKRFLRRDVGVGVALLGKVEVLSGLKEGEEIVVKGAFLLKSDILREKMGAGCAD